jgi:SdpC family antimicrobial peptide
MKRLTPLLAGLLGLTAPLAGACSSPDGSAPTESASVQSRTDGLTIFKGLYFGDGAIADRFPEIWKNDAAAKLEAEVKTDPEKVASNIEAAAKRAKEKGWSDAIVNQALEVAAQVRRGEGLPAAKQDQAAMQSLLVARMAELDAGFFDRFADNVQSGDHVRVERTLQEAGTLLKRALEGLVDESSGTGFDGAWYFGPQHVAVTVYGVVAGAVAVVTAAVVLFWAVAILPDGTEEGGMSRLGRAELIHIVSERLYAR